MADESRSTLERRTRHGYYIRIAISACALALLAVHKLVPTLLPSDTLGLGLLIIFILPWIVLAVPLSEIELLGVKMKVTQLADEQRQHGEVLTQQSQTLADHGKIINDLVTYSMSASIFTHLCGIGLLKEYGYEDNESNRREFYFLMDNGFIEPKLGGFLEFNNRTPHNVCEIATPTPIGWQCIKLRKNEVPTDWLLAEKSANLARHPSIV
jgi:hypothetical protein